jgi:hypothetical protein
MADAPPRFGRPRRDEIVAESLNNIGPGWPDFRSVDLGEELLLAAAIVAFVLIVVPILFFGIELIILGALLAAGVIARTALRQPWRLRRDRPSRSPQHVDSNGAFRDGGTPAG